jgi:murein DD-endopeptidase MepM/ murein hydrolase activator NlpD
MSRFAPGMHKVSKISQAEIIGYVGAPGWATGPHLHSEFRVNNEARDPMSIDVPNAQPLTTAELQRFRSVSAEITHRFALLRPQTSEIKLASAK